MGNSAFQKGSISVPVAIADGGTGANTAATALSNLGALQANLYSALSSNSTYAGMVETGTVGETVAFGDVLYLKFSDGKWWKAKADAYATTPGARMAMGPISANASGILLIEGNVRLDSWTFADGRVFLSAATGGLCTTTSPSSSGNQVQILGIAKTSTTMYFRPSYDVGTV